MQSKVYLQLEVAEASLPVLAALPLAQQAQNGVSVNLRLDPGPL